MSLKSPKHSDHADARFVTFRPFNPLKIQSEQFVYMLDILSSVAMLPIPISN